MNINFNQIIKATIPFFIIFLIAYIINTVLYIYLPKKPILTVQKVNYDVEYTKYKIYQNFKEKIVVEKKKTKKKKKTDYKLISNIILKAIYSTQNNGGWIIISEKSSDKTHILSVGDVFKNYKLKLLYKNYVIFSKHKKEYKLEIKADKKTDNYTIGKDTNIKKTVPEDIKIEESNNGYILKRKLIDNYTKDISKVWREINIQDYKVDGKLDGFIIKSIAKNSIFKKLGLKKGDIIKKVNNIALKSYADAFGVYKKLNRTKNLSFEIMRDNQEMELEYEIK